MNRVQPQAFAFREHFGRCRAGIQKQLIAAARRPTKVRSLTLIEPAVYLLPEDPEVARLKRLGDAVLLHGLDAEPAMLREFLRLAGAPVVG